MDHQGQIQRLLGLRLEILDFLRLALLVDFKLVALHIGYGPVILIEDTGNHAHQIHVNSNRRSLIGCAVLRLRFRDKLRREPSDQAGKNYDDDAYELDLRDSQQGRTPGWASHLIDSGLAKLDGKGGTSPCAQTPPSSKYSFFHTLPVPLRVSIPYRPPPK